MESCFLSILISAVFFIVWDIIFTKMGVWSFNPRYHSGIEFFDLPIEEWLFFVCIPYASLFYPLCLSLFLSQCFSFGQNGKNYLLDFDDGAFTCDFSPLR